MRIEAQPEPQTWSCCARLQRCLSSEETVQAAKVAFWWIGTFASIAIPEPFSKGFAMGATMFKGMHELAKHPDSVFRHNAETEPRVLSRTWKHLTAGAVISGIGGGLGTFAMYTYGSPFFFAVGFGIGLYVGTKVAYSDLCCEGDYTHVARPVDERFLLQQRLLQEASVRLEGIQVGVEEQRQLLNAEGQPNPEVSVAETPTPVIAQTA